METKKNISHVELFGCKQRMTQIDFEPDTMIDCPKHRTKKESKGKNDSKRNREKIKQDDKKRER